jgi:hypothetical protein
MSAALVNYPGLGSVWLSDAKIVGDYVEGWVEETKVCDSELRPMELLNFPVTCIRKWENGGTA